MTRKPYVAILTDPPPGEKHRTGLAWKGWCAYGEPEFCAQKDATGFATPEEGLMALRALPEAWIYAFTIRARKEEQP